MDPTAAFLLGFIVGLIVTVAAIGLIAYFATKNFKRKS